MPAVHSVQNNRDVIDSREIIERIDYLTDEDYERSGPEEIELAALRALAEEAEGYASDWAFGATLVRDSYFAEYAEQLAEDIGAIDRNAEWPLNHIDWAAAAEQLQQDYTAIDFDGVTYWVA